MGNRPRKPITTPDTRERRVDVRASVDTYIRAAVTHEDSARKVHGWVRNLGPGGMFVETPDSLPEDARVTLDALARTDGDVVHLKIAGWVAYAGPKGLGLQFNTLDDEMARRLAALIERFAARETDPGISDSPQVDPPPDPPPDPPSDPAPAAPRPG
jgi:hypothetical protein